MIRQFQTTKKEPESKSESESKKESESESESESEKYKYPDSDEDPEDPDERGPGPLEKKSLLIFCVSPQSMETYKGITLSEKILKRYNIGIDRENVYFKTETGYFKWNQQDGRKIPMFQTDLPVFGIVLNEGCPCVGTDSELFNSILYILQFKLELLGYYLDPVPIVKNGPGTEEQLHCSRLPWIHVGGKTTVQGENNDTITFQIYRKVAES
jgi:hypothetical protein